MTDDFDRLLRAVVVDLAGEGRPVDLSRPALRAARRIRARRVATATLSVVVLVIGLAVAVIRSGGTDRTSPPAGRTPAPVPSSAEPWPTATVPHSKERRPVLLPDWEVRGLPTADGVLVFDDAQERYRPVRVPGGVASPDGRYVVGVDGGRLRIHTVADGQDVPHALPPAARPGAAPAWSPDSTKVAYVAADAGSTVVVIVDLTLRSQVSSAPVPCPSGCDLRVEAEGAFVFHDGGYTSLSPTSGAPARQQPRPLSDPCPGRRSYRLDPTHLSRDAVARIDGPFQVWACLAPGAFELRTEQGTLIETTRLPTTVDGHRIEPDPARVTLYQWAGCTADEQC